MTIAKLSTATLALGLAIALSPLSGSQAAPLAGASSQTAATGLVTPVAAKEKSKPHSMRHHRHHRMHSKRHGGCHGTYMYYSRKDHKCMDARSK